MGLVHLTDQMPTHPLTRWALSGDIRRRPRRPGAVLTAATAVYRLGCAIFGRKWGVGASRRALGPVRVRIDAPRAVAFDVIAEPYVGRTPHALERKLRVLERDQNTVLAEHYTQTGRVLATTLERVRFHRPERIEFELVRGPVPRVSERFELREVDGATELDYAGELGTDLWALGRRWGATVAERWEATVRTSLDAIKEEAERRARRRPAG
jgi:hypothetical protein